MSTCARESGGRRPATPTLGYPPGPTHHHRAQEAWHPVTKAPTPALLLDLDPGQKVHSRGGGGSTPSRGLWSRSELSSIQQVEGKGPSQSLARGGLPGR